MRKKTIAQYDLHMAMGWWWRYCDENEQFPDSGCSPGGDIVNIEEKIFYIEEKRSSIF